ncbi:sporulation membrane protein YtaF [Peribacillus sp. SCS-37]|uniref:sporulation membrane protein YtaF n=1 Tax=Paraperibacillus esterisolvens TaxID=3115296 RepID=UPI003905FAAD
MFAEILFIMALGISLSFDSFTVGFSYGLKGIAIPYPPLVIIGALTGAAFFLSMLIGHSLSRHLPSGSTVMIGALILIFLGISTVLNSLRKKENLKTGVGPDAGSKRKSMKLFNVRIVIEILNQPELADADQSGRISLRESLMLGLALSLDALGAGIGAALQGTPIILTPVFMAVISSAILLAGTKAGKKCRNVKGMSELQVLPGFMLILLGLYKLIF